MRIRVSYKPRRGQLVVLTAIMMFALCMVLALALDLGLMAIARNQCQAAADMAAMAGARGLNGYDNLTSKSTAQTYATTVATSNYVLSQQIATTNLTYTNGANVGLYYYNSARTDLHGNASPGFSITWNPSIDSSTNAPINPATGLYDNYTAVQVQITFNTATGAFTTSGFGKMAGLSGFNTAAIATSAHIPRDIAILQDFSTSMRYDSMLAMPKNYGRFQSMLGDANIPMFGHFSDISGAALSAAGTTAGPNTSAANNQSSYPPTSPNNWVAATLPGLVQAASPSPPCPLFLNDTGELCSPGNLIADTGDGPAVASYYYQSPITTANPAQAFTSASTTGTPVPGTYTPVNYVATGSGANVDNFPFANLNTQPTAGTLPTYAAVVNSQATTNAPPMLLPTSSIYCGQPPTTTAPSTLTGNSSAVTSNTSTSASDYFDLAWELDGYAGYSNGTASTSSSHPLYTSKDYGSLPFHGYIQGPSYWGVSFFTWPPDPRVDPTPVLSSGNATAIANYNLNCKLIIQAIFNYTPTTGSAPVDNSLVGGLYNASASTNSSVTGWAGWTKGKVSKFTDWLTLGYSTADIVSYLTNVGGLTATDPRIAQVCRLFNRGQPAGGTATNGGSGSNFSADWRARFFYASDGKTPLTNNLATTGANAISGLWNSSGAWQPPWDSAGNVNYVINYNALMGWFNNLQGATTSPLASTSISPSNPTGCSSQMHGGGIQYYASVPQAVNGGAWSAPFTTLSSMNFPGGGPTAPTGNHITGGNTDEMFWFEFVNETLGLQAVQQGGTYNGQKFFYVVLSNNAGNTSPTGTVGLPYAGIGSDWTWTNTTMQVSNAPSSWSSPSSAASLSQYGGLYMNHLDNPPRPKSKFWFGALNMLDMMGNVNIGRYWFSGNCSEAPTFQCKLGVQSALNDMKVNHPNDLVSLIFFSSPGAFNKMVAAPLGRQYVLMDNAEWFAPATINNSVTSINATAQGNKEFTPYDDSLMNSVPRASGGTCYAQGLMLAYNQFSYYTNLKTQYGNSSSANYLYGGGNGRQGAIKLLIVESDGVNKDGATATLTAGGGSTTPGSGNGQQYYNVFGSLGDGGDTQIGDAGTVHQTIDSQGRVQWSMTYSNSSTPMSDALNVVATLCSDVAYQGYSTQRRPVLAHCIAFGSLFNPVSTSPYTPSSETNAPAVCLQMMHNIEVMGSIQPLSGGATPNGIATSKIITGPWNQASPPGRVQLMQAAFQSILQDGLEIALICSSSVPGQSN
jgi:Flp pilus assembly protein TadG